MDKSIEGTLGTLYVSHKDRLCRFGFELLEHIFKKFGSRIVVDEDEDKVCYLHEININISPQTKNSLMISSTSSQSSRLAFKAKGDIKAKKAKKSLQKAMTQTQKKKNNRRKKAKDPNMMERAIKVKIHPTGEQNKILHQWFGIARVTWNDTIDEIYKQGHEKDWEKLRDKLVTLQNISQEELKRRPWLYDNSICPTWMREEVVHTAVSAVSSTEESLLSKGKEFRYEMGYKSKKDIRNTVTISTGGGSTGWSLRVTDEGIVLRTETLSGSLQVSKRTRKRKGLIQPSELQRITEAIVIENSANEKVQQWQRETQEKISAELEKLKSKGETTSKKLQRLQEKLVQIPVTFRRQAKLTFEQPDNYYISIPISKQKPAKTISSNPNIIALDPGVRTFHTGFDTSGMFHEFGKSDISRIFRLGKHTDKLISALSTLKGRSNRVKRRRTKRAIGRMRVRMKNLIHDAHCKLIKYLLESFDCILLPKFEVSSMVKKSTRRIRSKTVRQVKHHQ